MDDAVFFVGFFAFIFVLWLISGGPTRPISFAGPVLHTTVSYGGTTSSNSRLPHIHYRYNSAQKSKTQNTDNRQIEQKLSTINTQISNLSKEVGKNVAFGIASPYRGDVTLNHYISGAGSSNPDREYIILRVSESASSPVTISGWRLESGTTGKAAIIPKGTKIPRSGIVNPSMPIVINPGEEAIISSGQSPIGASFQENICTGYFTQYQSFYPSMPLVCPIPKKELERNYQPQPYSRDLTCITYVQHIRRCTLAATIPSNLTTSCSIFLTDYINYNGCVTAHQNNIGFLGNTWRIYLGRTSSMWRKRYETVILRDAKGRTVDMFSY